MVVLVLIPIALQALAMAVDEVVFHRRRGLPRWERIGHVVDTCSIIACLSWLAIAPTSERSLWVYGGLAVFSSLLVTKDEPVHAKLCGGTEQWLHATLFVLHPIVLAMFAWLWWHGQQPLIGLALAATSAFAIYQFAYWNVLYLRNRQPINNEWYSNLGSRWYNAQDTPIALLRAEARQRNPWIRDVLNQAFGGRSLRVLDVGCGAGLLTNALAQVGHAVTGLDTTPENLAIARQHDRSGRARYVCGDARSLPYEDESFDVVCAMDVLEHVEDPESVLAEVSRVLAPSGMFFFHTFNRTWQSNLIVIKGVEWFVANAPKALHVLRMFLTPEELTRMCKAHGLTIERIHGSRPRVRWPLWRMVFTGKVGDDFEFTFTSSTKLGYTGYARKRSAAYLPGQFRFESNLRDSVVG